MKIKFDSFSKEDASKLLNDKVDLSLYIAKKFLEKIPNNFPNDSKQRIDFEILTEGFLLFIIAARDGLLQEINQKLSTPLNERHVDLRGNTFQNKLTTDPNPKFSQIWDLISDSVQQPQKVILSNSPEFWEWDRTKSWLWEINDLRNRIAHRTITSQAINATVGGGINTKLTITTLSPKPIIRLNQNEEEVPITNPKEESIHEENPKQYFLDCFKKFEILRDNIRNLL